MSTTELGPREFAASLAAATERMRGLAWAGVNAHRLAAAFHIRVDTPSAVTATVALLGNKGDLAPLVEWLHAEQDEPREGSGWRRWRATTDEGVTVELAETGHPAACACRGSGGCHG